MQQNYPNQPPYGSAPYMPMPQYEQPQQQFQPEKQEQEVSPQKSVYHTKRDADLREQGTAIVTPSEYKAQFRHPIPHKKNTSNSRSKRTTEE